MSVFSEAVASKHNESPEDFLRGTWATWYLVALPVDHVRQSGQRVYLDLESQDPHDWHPSHAAVEGDKKNPRTRKKLGEHFQWVVAPPQQA